MGWVVEEGRFGTPYRLLLISGEGSLRIPGYLIAAVRNALQALGTSNIERIARKAGMSHQVVRTILESADLAVSDGDGLWTLRRTGTVAPTETEVKEQS